MAVYTRVEESELAVFLTDYDIGEATHFSGIIQGVENSNYRLTTTAGDYILTLYEKRVNRADLPFFIGLMSHMVAAGITCPEPIADRGGNILKELNGKAAAIVTFLSGVSHNAPSVAQCQAAGTALAEMHLAGMRYEPQRHNNLDALAWRPLLDICAASDAEKLLPNLWEQASHRLDAIVENWPSDLPKGILHADFFPDNVLFTNDTVTGIIDFYFACNDILAYDLAITLNAWCFDLDGSFNITKAKKMIAGYQQARMLEAAEIAALPILCRGAAMRFFLTRLYDHINTPADAQVEPHDPMVYWQRLDFHHQVDSPQAYGVTI